MVSDHRIEIHINDKFIKFILFFLCLLYNSLFLYDQYASLQTVHIVVAEIYFVPSAQIIQFLDFIICVFESTDEFAVCFLTNTFS